MLPSQAGQQCPKGNQLGDSWLAEEGSRGINLLELKADHMAVLILGERETKTRIDSVADGQLGCISIHKKNWGYSESKSKPSEQRIVETSNREWYHNYCRISPREAQYSSRQVISKKDSSEWKLNLKI